MPWEILKISNSSQKRNCPDTPHFWVTVAAQGQGPTDGQTNRSGKTEPSAPGMVMARNT